MKKLSNEGRQLGAAPDATGAAPTGIPAENITVLCDVDNSDAAAQRLPNTKKYNDLSKICDSPSDFDAVIVSTSEHTHTVATYPALTAGKHVSSKKPLNRDVWEAGSIRRAGKTSCRFGARRLDRALELEGLERVAFLDEASGSDAILEQKTSRVLRRIGLGTASDDRELVTALMPFVIHREFLNTIPPLASVPQDYIVLSDTNNPSDSASAPSPELVYRNVPLPPLPVLAPVLAPFLAHLEHDTEVAFVDGHNVYGANRFERHEGTRLLRRAVGYLYDELAADGDDFDIISCEADGFLISRQRRKGRIPLEERMRQIIARMAGTSDDVQARNTTRARLATFFRYARTSVLAPATVAYEPRDDLSTLLLPREIYSDRTFEERLARLQRMHDPLSSLLSAISRRAPREQAILLNLMEHRLYDPVLERLADRLSLAGHRVRAFSDPAHLLHYVNKRSMSFYRLELLSLLKAINEHPAGGFSAGDEALGSVYRVLITTLQHALRDADVDPSYEICTFRRWGEFYFGVDGEIAGRENMAADVERAFESTPYMAIQCHGRPRRSPRTVALFDRRPSPTGSEIVLPLIPTVTLETQLSEDMLSTAIEEPGRKLRAIEKRLAGEHVPNVDIVFIADWILNACDATRGIPRLVNLLGATDGDIRDLARYYASYVSRKGRLQYRIRRERRAIHGFERRLREMIQATKLHEGDTRASPPSPPVESALPVA